MTVTFARATGNMFWTSMTVTSGPTFRSFFRKHVSEKMEQTCNHRQLAPCKHDCDILPAATRNMSWTSMTVTSRSFFRKHVGEKMEQVYTDNLPYTSMTVTFTRATSNMVWTSMTMTYDSTFKSFVENM